MSTRDPCWQIQDLSWNHWHSSCVPFRVSEHNILTWLSATFHPCLLSAVVSEVKLKRSHDRGAHYETFSALELLLLLPIQFSLQSPISSFQLPSRGATQFYTDLDKISRRAARVLHTKTVSVERHHSTNITETGTTREAVRTHTYLAHFLEVYFSSKIPAHAEVLLIWRRRKRKP